VSVLAILQFQSGARTNLAVQAGDGFEDGISGPGCKASRLNILARNNPHLSVEVVSAWEEKLSIPKRDESATPDSAREQWYAAARPRQMLYKAIGGLVVPGIEDWKRSNKWIRPAP